MLATGKVVAGTAPGTNRAGKSSALRIPTMINWVRRIHPGLATVGIAALALGLLALPAPTAEKNEFADVLKKMSAAKPELTKQQRALLEQRYNLENKAAEGVKMSGGKAVQGG